MAFLLQAAKAGTVVDPFCGEGTVLAAANAYGMHAIGVDLSAKRCRHARALRLFEAIAGGGIKQQTRNGLSRRAAIHPPYKRCRGCRAAPRDPWRIGAHRILGARRSLH